MNIRIVHFERSPMYPLCGADDLNGGTNNKHFVTCPDCKKLLLQLLDKDALCSVKSGGAL